MEIAEYNGIANPNFIRVGQLVTIPGELAASLARGLTTRDHAGRSDLADTSGPADIGPEQPRVPSEKRSASSVTYRSQRDNDGVFGRGRATWGGAAKGDAMCNVTSLAMAMEAAGATISDTGGRDWEDVADEKLYESHGLSKWSGFRETQAGQTALAAMYGMEVDQERYRPEPKDGADLRTKFETIVKPRLEAGEGATLGILWSGNGWPHIVHRARSPTAEGASGDAPISRLLDPNRRTRLRPAERHDLVSRWREWTSSSTRSCSTSGSSS